MGYTHYFTYIGKHDPARWKEIFPQLSKDASTLIAASGINILNPITKDHKIIVPGKVEALCLDDKAGSKKFAFVKTGRHPYDTVVTAILLRAIQLLGPEYMETCTHNEVESDGRWSEWRDGRKLVRKVFPDDEVVCPWREDRMSALRLYDPMYAQD